MAIFLKNRSLLTSREVIVPTTPINCYQQIMTKDKEKLQQWKKMRGLLKDQFDEKDLKGRVKLTYFQKGETREFWEVEKVSMPRIFEHRKESSTHSLFLSINTCCSSPFFPLVSWDPSKGENCLSVLDWVAPFPL